MKKQKQVRVRQCPGNMGHEATDHDAWSFMALLAERITAAFPDVEVMLEVCSNPNDQGCTGVNLDDEVLSEIRDMFSDSVWDEWCNGVRSGGSS